MDKGKENNPSKQTQTHEVLLYRKRPPPNSLSSEERERETTTMAVLKVQTKEEGCLLIEKQQALMQKAHEGGITLFSVFQCHFLCFLLYVYHHPPLLLSLFLSLKYSLIRSSKIHHLHLLCVREKESGFFFFFFLFFCIIGLLPESLHFLFFICGKTNLTWVFGCILFSNQKWWTIVLNCGLQKPIKVFDSENSRN